MILMPPGFGNAFLVTSDYAVYNYKLAYHGIIMTTINSLPINGMIKN